MKSILLSSTCLSCIGLYMCANNLSAKEVNKPNVLVIYTDDHRYTGIHALGGEAVITPNLDNLVYNGICFTNAYLQGAFTGATSVPSRAMLLTGRNLFSLNGTGHNIPVEHTMMPEAFKEAGYFCYHIGKWHQDNKSLARSFNSGSRVTGQPLYLLDKYRMPFSYWNSEGEYSKKNCYLCEYDKSGNPVNRIVGKEPYGPIGNENTAPHIIEILSGDAVKFISDYDNKNPFFVYLSLPSPHDPCQCPKKYKDMYPANEINLPPSFMAQHPFDNGDYVSRDEKLASWPRTQNEIKGKISDYYAAITHTDAQIGLVIKALKDAGLYDNTIIIMAGDSGLVVGNHGLMGKQNLYNEDGIHVPLIISGGALDKQYHGKRLDALCYIHDIMPTVLDITDIKIPKSVNGKSLLPVIKGKQKDVREYCYFAYRQHQRAIRIGNYKLIEYVRAKDYNKQTGNFISGSRVTQLFNIKTDPWETNNLANFPEYTEMIKDMREKMKIASSEYNDTYDKNRSEYSFWEFY